MPDRRAPSKSAEKSPAAPNGGTVRVLTELSHHSGRCQVTCFSTEHSPGWCPRSPPKPRQRQLPRPSGTVRTVPRACSPAKTDGAFVRDVANGRAETGRACRGGGLMVTSEELPEPPVHRQPACARSPRRLAWPARRPSPTICRPWRRWAISPVTSASHVLLSRCQVMA